MNWDGSTKVEIIELTPEFGIHFIYVPDGYNVSSYSVTEHETKIIGRLKQFNRIKLIKTWKQDHSDLVGMFTELLIKRGWDFETYPNPIAFGVIQLNRL